MRGRIGGVVLFLLGVTLAITGQYTLANNDAAATLIVQMLGERGLVVISFMHAVFPPAVAVGLCILLLGTALVAYSIGLPPAARGVTTAGPSPLSARPVLRGWGIGLAVSAVVVAGLGAFLVMRPQPGMGAVVVWLTTIIAALGAMLLFDRARQTPLGNPVSSGWEALGLVVLVVLDVIWVAHDLTDWHWAGTPDESHFFMFAKALIEGRENVFPLSQHGVFGFNPVLSSYYQAAFMKLFGANLVGWRLSSVAALACSLPPVYLLARELWSRRAACVAAVLLGTGQLPVGFAHLGYDNVQVYPVVTGSLAMMAWSIRRRSLAGYFLAGGVAGLGFFTYSTAILSAVLLVLLLWSLGRISLEPGVPLQIGALVLGVLLTALPMLLHSGEFVVDMFRLSGLGGTLRDSGAAHGGGLVAPVLARITRIQAQWMLSVLHAPWFPCPSHFQPQPIVDPVSAVLATVGLWLGVGASMRRSGATRFLFVGYLLSTFVVGAISPYPCPALTRLLFVAPFTALFAAVAFDQVLRYAATVTTHHTVLSAVGGAVIAAAVVSSTVALHRSVYEQHHGYGDGTTSELIRLMQQLPDNCRIVFIQTEQTFMEAVDQVFATYDAEKRLTYLKPFNPQVKAVLTKLTPPFLVSYDLRTREEIDTVVQTLQERFPNVHWQDSAPGQSWNLRYFYVQAVSGASHT